MSEVPFLGMDATSFVVLIDGERKGSGATEPKAVAEAYRLVDQMVDDAEVLAACTAAQDSRNWVGGPRWSPETPLGGLAWVEYRGCWRRGVSVSSSPKTAVVAILVGERIRRVRKPHDEIIVGRPGA